MLNTHYTIMLNTHPVLGLVRVLDPTESEVLKQNCCTLILYVTFQGILSSLLVLSLFALLKRKNSPPNNKALS